MLCGHLSLPAHPATLHPASTHPPVYTHLFINTSIQLSASSLIHRLGTPTTCPPIHPSPHTLTYPLTYLTTVRTAAYPHTCPPGHSSFSPLFTRHACPGPWPFLCHPPLHSTALYSVHSILRSQGCLLLGVSGPFHLSKESVHLLSLLPASLHPFFMCNKQDHVCHMPLCTGRTCEFPALELPMGSEVETRVLRQCRGPPFAQGRGAGLQTPWEGWKVLTAGKPGQENFWSRHSSRI